MADFGKLIADYIAKNKAPDKDVFTQKDITNELLNKWDFELDGNETPLILVNKPKALLKTAMLITNKNIYYKVLKRSFWTSIAQMFAKPSVQVVPFSSITHFQIGEHDACFGNDYVGHNLEINQEVVGLVRMGTGILLNENIIKYINSLSEYLVGKGALKIKPKEYAWQ